MSGCACLQLLWLASKCVPALLDPAKSVGAFGSPHHAFGSAHHASGSAFGNAQNAFGSAQHAFDNASGTEDSCTGMLHVAVVSVAISATLLPKQSCKQRLTTSFFSARLARPQAQLSVLSRCVARDSYMTCIQSCI